MVTTNTVPVDASDERLHVPESDPLWSESLYLNFSDSEGRLGGFTRMALHPAKRESEGLFCLYLPDGRVGATYLIDDLKQPDASGIRAQGMEHRCIRPFEQWRVRFDGELYMFDDPKLIATAIEPNAPPAPTEHVKIDLEAAGIHPAFFYPNYRRVTAPPPHKRESHTFGRKFKRALFRPHEIRQALRMRSARHYEQSMIVNGSVTLNGRSEILKGTGHRDHSWGLRDWSASHRFRWLTGQMDGLAFNAMYLTVAGTHVTNGYVWDGKECAPIEELRLENSFDDTGLAGRDICADISAGGRRFLITGNVLLNVPLPIRGPGFSTMYNVGRTRYRCGDKEGYGVAEFLERLYP